jgi:hypothetical protein
MVRLLSMCRDMAVTPEVPRTSPAAPTRVIDCAIRQPPVRSASPRGLDERTLMAISQGPHWQALELVAVPETHIALWAGNDESGKLLPKERRPQWPQCFSRWPQPSPRTSRRKPTPKPPPTPETVAVAVVDASVGAARAVAAPAPNCPTDRPMAELRHPAGLLR